MRATFFVKRHGRRRQFVRLDRPLVNAIASPVGNAVSARGAVAIFGVNREMFATSMVATRDRAARREAKNS
jgi:hypothetical protein